MSAELIVAEGPREVARLAAERMAVAVRAALDARGWACVGLPAGRALQPVLDELARASLDWSLVEFFFSEERCVPRTHPASAWAGAAGRLLENPRIAEDQLRGMDACAHDPQRAAERYAEELPERLDVMLLQPAADGSLGALRPGSPAFAPGAARVVALRVEQTPHGRLCVGPEVVRAAREVVVTAWGPERAGLVQRVRAPGARPESVPAVLARERTWVVDRWAAGPAPGASLRWTASDVRGREK